MSPSGPSLEVGSTLGKFVLRELLGEGGMGIVFLAEDTSLKRRVALKVMQPHIAKHPQARQRFLREARAAAQVENERIVRVYDVGEVAGIPYISMELLSGQSLQDFLETSPRPAMRFTLEVIRQVAEGLNAAHASDPPLIHRDIKPGNIWLKSGSNRKRIDVKILDFGLARAAEGDSISIKSGSSLGTPGYMSPEQWRGKEVDHRSDLFSLGVMLYQMSTGEAPFRGTANQIMYQITMEHPTPPLELNHNLPDSVVWLIEKLISKDKESRPGSAREVVRAIERIQAELTEEASPFPPSSRGQGTERDSRSNPPPLRTPARGRSPLLLLGMLFLGLAIGTAAVLLVKRDSGKGGAGDEVRTKQLEEQIAQLTQANQSLRQSLGEGKDGDRPDMLKLIHDHEVTIASLQKQLNEKSRRPADENFLDKDQNERIKQLEAERLTLQLDLVTERQRNDNLERRLAEISRTPAKGGKPAILDCTGERGADATTVRRAQKEWADYLGVPVETTVDLGGGVKMEFVLVPPGKFYMGAPITEGESSENERPLHLVTLTKPFYMGKYEVTQEEYVQITGKANPSYHRNEINSPRHPVEDIDWPEIKMTWEKLSAKNLPRGFTRAELPTEAQWEYACRAGTRTPFSFGSSLNGKEANCDGRKPYGTTVAGDYLGITTPAGKYKPNALGLYDMHGNVWEWCQDEWDGEAFRVEGRTDPLITNLGTTRRCLRGGCWIGDPSSCRSACRGGSDTVAARSSVFGFRLSLQP